MTETVRKTIPPPSPLSNFRMQHCNDCLMLSQCANNDKLELRCILSRIALDLHTITRNDTFGGKHLNW